MVQTLISQITQLRVLGRTAGRTQPQPMYWAASGLEFRFTGSELWLELEADYETVAPWISVEVNGSWIARFPISRGTQQVCILRELTDGIPKHVRILKDTQAVFDDPRHLLCAVAFHYPQGEFLPLPPAEYRLEFVGDSLTSGEGVLGAKQEEDWSSMFFGAMNDYAYLTAQRMHAEYRTISQSGWGIFHSWSNSPHQALGNLYPYVCAAAHSPQAKELGAQQLSNPTLWQADAVIVNLGTNDNSAFFNPPWTDPNTGLTHKLSCDEQGHFLPQDAQRIEDAAVELMEQIRQQHPNAHIVWCYGMVAGSLEPVLQRAVQRMVQQDHDSKCHYLSLPVCTEDTIGSRQHPGIPCHHQAAACIASYLQSIL